MDDLSGGVSVGKGNRLLRVSGVVFGVLLGLFVLSLGIVIPRQR